MSPFWQWWFHSWCGSMILFALLVAGGALEATDAPFRLMLHAVSNGEPILMTPALRFSTGMLGGVFLGWMVSIAFTLRIAMTMGSAGMKENARPLWIASTLGLAAWYVTDSTLSVATGFAPNALLNTLALVFYLVGLIGSGALSRHA
jgi:hypothetical protein